MGIDLRTAQRVARALGWFGLALGLFELLAPKRVNRAIGARLDGTLRGTGYREMVNGFGLLRSPTAPWVWGRVAGHAVDLATLGGQYQHAVRPSRRRKLGIALVTVGAVTAIDLLCAIGLTRRRATST